MEKHQISQSLPAGTLTPPAFQWQQNATIMMVDDDIFIMQLIESFLTDQGYQHFISISDSTQAIDKILEKKPDVLLLDLSMPKINGFDILEALREKPETQFLPIIILTSSTDAGNKLRTLELGATDFLSKPIDPSELALRLRNTLNAKAHLDRLENYDSLTGLPNRKLLIRRLSEALSSSKNTNDNIGLLKITIDRFKHINESFGLELGDVVLKKVSQRLAGTLRSNDIVISGENKNLTNELSRLGGDEFCILLPNLKHVKETENIARRIQKEFNKPFVVESDEIFLTVSIGIVTSPDDGIEPDMLLKNVDITADYAKRQGVNRYQFYAKELNQQSATQLKLETDLRKALSNGELEIFYQPKISTINTSLNGMEALLRWNHPTLGMISPTEFIPIAEELELIIPIGEWVLNEACKQYTTWQEQGIDGLTLSVNVSPIQLLRKDYFDMVKIALEKSKMNPEKLILEITESMVHDSSQKGRDILQSIKKIGPSFSIDDFGTGYSSLSSLKHLPISELKIDRSFIIDIIQSPDSAAIVKAIIAMANSLDLKVVAEGIETREQLQILKSLDCDIIQGYYYSEPLPANEFYDYANELINGKPILLKKA